MNPPPLLSFDLQHEDIVYVVMGAEALILRGSDVSVGLHRMAELCGELLAELENGRPYAVQRLQYQGRSVGKEPDQLVVAYLIGDPRADTARRGECLVGKGGAVLGDPEERCPQTPLRHKFVDRICTEQLGKPSWKISCWGQQRSLSPVLIGEQVAIDRNESGED